MGENEGSSAEAAKGREKADGLLLHLVAAAGKAERIADNELSIQFDNGALDLIEVVD